jgi:hypothetical protein
LSEFKNRRLISMQGSTLTIPDRAALENMANVPESFRGTGHPSHVKESAGDWRLRLDRLQ